MATVLPTGTWFSPQAVVVPSLRLGLDLGLRAADLHMRERIVPGLGGAWFTRQLTWPCIALRLAQTPRIGRTMPVTTLARAIEALAARLDFLDLPDREGGGWRRVRGIRAFNRIEDDGCWSVGELTDRRNYVQVTHRQQAVASLRGLGLAVGTRFARMALTTVGEELADAALAQKAAGPASLRTVIEQWVADDDGTVATSALKKGAAIRRVLSAFEPTDAERSILRRRLVEVEDAAGHARRALAAALRVAGAQDRFEQGIPDALSRAGRASQAADVRGAMAFGAVQGAGRALIDQLAIVVHDLGGRASVSTLAQQCTDACKVLAAAVNEFEALATEAEALAAGFIHPDARLFLRAIGSGAAAEVVAAVADRTPTLFTRSEDAVAQAPTFRLPEPSGSPGTPTGVDDEEDAPHESARTFRMAAFDEFMKEVGR
jgi:hypothetical protein